MEQTGKTDTRTVLSKVVQYVCIGLLALINWALVALVVSIFTPSTVTQDIISALIVGGVMALTFTPNIDPFFVFLRRLRKYERLEEHEKAAFPGMDAKYAAFVDMVQRTAEKYNIPIPQVYIASSNFPNVFFVTQRILAVTPTFIALFDPSQQEAALLHEVFHVKNNDVQLLTVADAANVFGGIVTWIATILLTLLGFSGHYGTITGAITGDADSARSGFMILSLVWLFRAVISFINLVVRILTLGISRSSEYLADEFVANQGYRDALVSYLSTMSTLDPKKFDGYAVELWKKHPTPKARITHVSAYSPKAVAY